MVLVSWSGFNLLSAPLYYSLKVVDLFGLGTAYFLLLFNCVCPWLVTSMMVLCERARILEQILS